ncbi:MAG: glucosaminidase domain-containing protein [Gammaproteobacteria bacterium]|nr:glucosaminidase domain-containing protein [Gammaproteobacteria bacterium]
MSLTAPILIFLLGFAVLFKNFNSVEKQVQPQIAKQSPVSVFPDFSTFTVVETKKQRFLDYLELFVLEERRSINVLRSKLLLLQGHLEEGEPLGAEENAWALALAKKYRLDPMNFTEREIVDELFLRVDLIPASLALAQAANESAWGTSRFTILGNNIFGQWCYETGCGIVPARRAPGARHEVKAFDTIQQSVEAYFLNINTHESYSYLRDLRAKMRERDLKLDPMSLAIGLGRYSQRGDRYVDEIQRIIIQNNLRARDG